MREDKFVIGVDYGSDSVRSVLINAFDGEEVASSVFNYPRWQQGTYCDPAENRFRQHPLDYIEGLETTIKHCLEQAGGHVAAQAVKAISVDTTGSTPVAVDKTGTPLALTKGFENNPNAMFILWKDHTSVVEAALINEHAAKFDINYLKYVGGIYSSEWFWAKLLHIIRVDEQVRTSLHSWVEHCDWIPFLLTGGTDVKDIKRGRCSAGHKALWAEEFGGLPPDDFFATLDPLLKGITNKLFTETYTADQAAGKLSAEWAGRLGLSTDVVIGTGAFDAHMGAVGGQIEPYYLSKVMGTSTCDILVAPTEEIGDRLVKGICGQVNGSVIPGMTGLEAGQSAFGDTYAWFKNVLLWPVNNVLDDSKIVDSKTLAGLKAEIADQIIPELSRQAALLPLDIDNELSIDWLNGRRTPDANQELKGAINGLGLGSDAPRVFRSLAEATCFGAKSIVDRFISEGIPVKGIIGIGGVAKKSPFVMQMMADVLGMPIRIHQFKHTCALGAAMFAAVVAEIYPTVADAMQAMGRGFDAEYLPNANLAAIYALRYQKYQTLGNFIAGEIKAKPAAATIEKKPIISKYQAIKDEAYEANMQLPKLGLVLFTFGNVSAVDRELGVFAIKPSGVPYEDLSPEKMVIVDFDGNVIEGDLRPSSDTQTHAVLYKHWPGIGGIVHTHSTYATAWAQSQRCIPIFGTTHADHLTVDIPCAPPMADAMIEGDYEYQTGFQIMNHFTQNGHDYNEVEMILVGNHAPFTWGKTAAKAVYNSAVLESVAQMALLTEQIESNAPRLKNALIKKHFERKHGPHSYYGQ
ncbi:ribulokinase [Mucilaginibacter corticis]|nr:ribulokinase [Mucilaginibacter corticis]